MPAPFACTEPSMHHADLVARDVTSSSTEPGGTWVSWNGNLRHRYGAMHRPETERELIDAIRGARGRVRVFGHRYSSADICAGGVETLIDMTGYDRLVAFDDEAMQITAQSGATLARVVEAAEARGWALPCLPDIAGVTLGGAIATGTHGTGREGHPLASYMVRCTLVLADGRRRVVERDDPWMDAVRVSLGVLGVFSEITLQCVPRYRLRLEERPMRDAQWLARLDALHEAHEFLRILWLPHTGHGYVITGDRVADDEVVREVPGVPWLGRRRALSHALYSRLHRAPALTPWVNRLLFRLFFSTRRVHSGTLYGATVTRKRSSTLELAEWTVPRSRFAATFAELEAALADPAHRAWAHVPMDIRFLQADRSWLSTAYGEPCVTVGCVSRDPEHAEGYAAFEVIERVFLAHGGRPHWAKRFRAGADELARLYPRWDDFVALRRELDPDGVFLNATLRTLFGG